MALTTLEHLGNLLAALTRLAKPSSAVHIPVVEEPQRPESPERWDLSVVERDPQGKVLRETGKQGDDMVERRTTHHEDGSLATRETTVTSMLPAAIILCLEKEAWGRSGKLLSSYREVNTLDNCGQQAQGECCTRDFREGQLVEDVTEQWSPETKDWSRTRVLTMEYYDDGDLKQAVTLHPQTQERTEETWSAQSRHGRTKNVRRWDPAAKHWVAA